MTENLGKTAHVAAERRKLFFNRLLITDIGKHPVEQRKGASFPDGKIAAVLVQQGKESEGLHRYGLPPGVRSREDDSVDPLLQDDRDRNRFLFQKRMTGVEKSDFIAVKPDDRASLFMGPAGERVISVSGTDGISEFVQQFFFLFGLESKFLKDFCDFNQNPVVRQEDGVVQVDKGERLHEHRLAA